MRFWFSNDEQLMDRVAQQSDEAAFAELIRRWQPRLEQAACRILGDRHGGQDVVQEAFTKLFLKRKQYRGSGQFSSYLWRIMINLSQDHLRRKRSRQRILSDDDVETVPPLHHVNTETPRNIAERNEEAEAVRNAIAELPDAVRIIVVLRHYQDLKFREIATALDLPEGTVKTRMTQGLNLLAKRIHKVVKAPTTSPPPTATDQNTSEIAL